MASLVSGLSRPSAIAEDATGPSGLTVEEQAWLKAHPVLKVGNETDWPPFDFAEDGQAKGFAIDYLSLVAQKVGLRLEFVNGYTWSQLMEMFKAGELDILPAIADSPERRAFTQFTRHYLTNPTAIVTRDEDTSVSSIDDLKGRRVAIVKGYYYEETVRREYPSITIVPVKGFLDGLETVVHGKAEAFIGSQTVISYVVRKHFVAGLRIVGRSGIDDVDRFKLRIGVRKELGPLVAILEKGMAAVTEEDGLGYVKEAMGSGDVLIEMVSSLLDVSKMESGETQLNPEEVDLGLIAGKVLQKLEALKGDKELNLEAPDDPVTLTCDSDLIRRTVQNLVGNSLKFTPDGGSVKVKLDTIEGKIRVSVVDTGPGIPPEYEDKIFEKSGQVEMREHKQKHSTGLGLTFCKLAVETHGGQIGVDSEVGKGSTFWFELPPSLPMPKEEEI